LPRARGLADKYQLPLLSQTLVAELASKLEHLAELDSAPKRWPGAKQDNLENQIWTLAAHLWATDDHTLEMREVLLATLRAHAEEYMEKSDLVKEKLSQIPKLAIELAMNVWWT